MAPGAVRRVRAGNDRIRDLTVAVPRPDLRVITFGGSTMPGTLADLAGQR